MDGIFLPTYWGADANIRTDNILCDTMKTCCLSHNDRPDFPSGRSIQRAAPVSIPWEGFEFEQIVVIVAYTLRARARTFVVFSPAALRPCYRAFAG